MNSSSMLGIKKQIIRFSLITPIKTLKTKKQNLGSWTNFLIFAFVNIFFIFICATSHITRKNP